MDKDTGAIIAELKKRADRNAVDGMSRFGINTKDALGVSIPELRKFAKRIGTNHETAIRLWKTGVHEARILASFVDDYSAVSEGQMEEWAGDFDSWDLCDQCCSNLFDRTKFAYGKAIEWPKREEEYVKRAGFVLMAALSVHNKEMRDAQFERFIPIIERECLDERNFVRKAVNWALRQIGKRNKRLNRLAILSAERIMLKDSNTAKWIANDALRELKSNAVQGRLHA
ncbi:MAG: DNA alkylation repair protein [Candidatus Micrarchaeaceae archaeon]|nr:DNA alkylation repair protein [Candidatus Micrarchaeota archaeon]HII10284.1 DNA alkylation repair protein [Candidatus Micrarchaeota archaeon]